MIDFVKNKLKHKTTGRLAKIKKKWRYKAIYP